MAWAIRAALIAALLCACGLDRAYAGVGVVLNESLHESLDRITGTGHTAVYFSNICPETPIKLRLCGPGEYGSVMSVYINIGEDQPFGWNIVPLSVYLYGVEDPARRPIFGSYKVKRALEDRYREIYLSELCSTAACQTSTKAEWREMVAATLIRSVYIFAVDTTLEQDKRVIAEFNASVNKDNFNGFKRNCADFTRSVIDTYFPKAVRRDYINDFGMTSPKAVARTFTRYAKEHPESNFRVMHFAQGPGTIERSSEVRAGTEQLYRSKKWLVPMTVLAYHELPFAAGSYLLIGRFNPEHTFEKNAVVAPGDELAALAAPQSVATPDEKRAYVGSSSDWKAYRQAFEALLKDNQSEVERGELKHLFKKLDKGATASVDPEGSVWMDIAENGEPLRVGVSANNVLARGSNVQVAYKFLLARTQSELKSPMHSRETMQDFKADWAKLERASAQMQNTVAANSAHVTVKIVEGND
jgi:hypothetical protein